MLRIIVISLVIANLLLLGFQVRKPAAQPETVVPQTVVEDSNIPTIHLFSELMQDWDLLSGNRNCFSLGPFHSSDEKDKIRSQLLGVSAYISERQTRAQVEKGYWVFMPPYVSLLEANQALLSLQALGLTDIAVRYEGEWKNAISLGYFLQQKNALRRKKSLEDRGYAPMMIVMRRTEPRYWLDYEQNPGSGLIALDIQNQPNDFMQRSLPCPDQDLFDITAGGLQVPADDLTQVQAPEINNGSQPGQDAGMDAGEGLEGMPDDTAEAEPDAGMELEPETGSEIETDGG